MAERRVWDSLPVRFVGTNGRYIVRSRSSAVLFALAVAALAPTLLVAQYAPKWQVGDWWVVKTWQQSMSGLGRGWEWKYSRYDVVGIEKVGGQDCYVLQVREQGRKGTLSKARNVLYVRTDSWLVVRQALTTGRYSDSLPTPVTRDYPLGLFGPFLAGEPRLPRFPLLPVNPDTLFRLQKRDDFSADLREISRVADPELARRLLAEGDTAGGRAIRPTGKVYEVRSELAGNLVLDSLPGQREIVQSLQLWCDNQPWRLFEELVDYSGVKHTRRVEERSWLITVGHMGE